MIKNMPFNEYLKKEACHKSALDHVKTAKHLKKFKKRSEDTDAMRFGRIFHTVILEPHLMKDIEVYDEQHWIPKKDHPENVSISDQKIAWKKERCDDERWYFKNSDEKEAIKGMEKSVRENPIAAQFLNGEGDNEVSLFWVDRTTGQPCKTRLDKVMRNDIIVELKTDVDPSPEAFGKKIYNMGYHIGAWFNREGFRAVTGRDIKAFVFIAVEKKEPFACGVYMMNAHDFEGGELDGYPLMKRYQIIQQGGFNDYNQGEDGKYEVMPVQTPGWELSKIDHALSEIEAPEEEGSEL